MSDPTAKGDLVAEIDRAITIDDLLQTNQQLRRELDTVFARIARGVVMLDEVDAAFADIPGEMNREDMSLVLRKNLLAIIAKREKSRTHCIDAAAGRTAREVK